MSSRHAYDIAAACQAHIHTQYLIIPGDIIISVFVFALQLANEAGRLLAHFYVKLLQPRFLNKNEFWESIHGFVEEHKLQVFIN